jgi:hypothetical protein
MATMRGASGLRASASTAGVRVAPIARPVGSIATCSASIGRSMPAVGTPSSSVVHRQAPLSAGARRCAPARRVAAQGVYAAGDKPWKAKNARLVLQDGSVWPGVGFGHTGTEVGEVVFNTSLTGYEEIMTDPSYKGQFVAFTCPHIGNVGINNGGSPRNAHAPRMDPMRTNAALGGAIGGRGACWGRPAAHACMQPSNTEWLHVFRHPHTAGTGEDRYAGSGSGGGEGGRARGIALCCVREPSRPVFTNTHAQMTTSPPSATSAPSSSATCPSPCRTTARARTWTRECNGRALHAANTDRCRTA